MPGPFRSSFVNQSVVKSSVVKFSVVNPSPARPGSAVLLFLLPALLLGACGQGAVTAAPDASVVAAPLPVVAAPLPVVMATLSLRVAIPAPSAALQLRPQFVSGATSSVRVQVGAFDTTVTLASAACTPASGGRSCLLRLNVAPGKAQALVVSAYDASGRLLGASSSVVDLTAGQDNPLSLTLTGVAVSGSVNLTDRAADVTLTPGGALLDRGGAYALSVALLDAGGQVILDPGRPAEGVSVSSPAFTVVKGGTGLYSVTAPEPGGAEQKATLSVKSADGAVLSTLALSVPAQQLTLALDSGSPVAGSNLPFTARLLTARGRPLPIAGRAVVLSTSGAVFASSKGATDTLLTDVAGTLSSSVSVGLASGTPGTLTASQDGVSASVSFVSTPGAASTTSSKVTLSPASVRAGGSSALSVTLQDAAGNPVTTPPTVSVTSGVSTLGPVSVNGNVFTYAVTAAALPETATFTVTSGGRVLGTANLLVSAAPLTVSDGAAALVSGSSRYDFQNSSAHAFTLGEAGYAGVFTASSSNAGVATLSVNGSVLTVTPGSTGGFSTVTVKDASGQSFSFDVSVITVTLTIN